MTPAFPRRALHARGAVRRRLAGGHRRHHARLRQGDDRRGLPPDDHVLPAGRARRDADRADREPSPRQTSTASATPCWRSPQRAKAGDAERVQGRAAPAPRAAASTRRWPPASRCCAGGRRTASSRRRNRDPAGALARVPSQTFTRRLDVGLGEVIALEQQRVLIAGHRIGEAVARLSRAGCPRPLSVARNGRVPQRVCSSRDRRARSRRRSGTRLRRRLLLNGRVADTPQGESGRTRNRRRDRFAALLDRVREMCRLPISPIQNGDNSRCIDDPSVLVAQIVIERFVRLNPVAGRRRTRC